MLLVGPRQCGKTTLAQTMGGDYFDLEQPGDQVRLDATWDRTMASRQVVVLDEAQCWPAVFPRLRAAIDAERDRHGRFLILGSVAPQLMHAVAESLAGRLAVVELEPLQLPEVGEDRLDDLWLCGGYPDGGIRQVASFPLWQRDYLSLLAARDLPQWGLTLRPPAVDRLLTMLAAVQGQQWNASQIGAGLGLSYHTVDAQVDVLEGAGLIRRLRPYAGNLAKRLAKRPKLYWRDSGLLHALLGVGGFEQLLRAPWVGASWEGFAITQILGALARGGRPGTGSFLRVNDDIECDLVLDLPDGPWLIEIKLTSRVSPADLTGLRRAAALLRPRRMVVVSRQAELIEEGDLLIAPLPALLARLRAG